ncbi:MAG: hypothetical protein KC636_06055 [Myxococcales bacterium]|nr:hypothetical protein [Myxococcales bacterium]
MRASRLYASSVGLARTRREPLDPLEQVSECALESSCSDSGCSPYPYSDGPATYLYASACVGLSELVCSVD